MRYRDWVLVALTCLLVACGEAPRPDALETLCSEEARAFDGQVAGAFGTTVGAIRRLEPSATG